jgi:hypothetical protein
VLSANSAYYTKRRDDPRVASRVRAELGGREAMLRTLLEIKLNGLSPQFRNRLRIFEYEDSTEELISFTKFLGGTARGRILVGEYNEAVDSPSTLELEYEPDRIFGRTAQATFEEKLGSVATSERNE